MFILSNGKSDCELYHTLYGEGRRLTSENAAWTIVAFPVKSTTPYLYELDLVNTYHKIVEQEPVLEEPLQQLMI